MSHCLERTLPKGPWHIWNNFCGQVILHSFKGMLSLVFPFTLTGARKTIVSMHLDPKKNLVIHVSIFVFTFPLLRYSDSQVKL